MTDDAFHLTPHDIRAQEFQRALRGYDRDEVEAFKERVSDELERLMRERAQLDERVRNFQEQLRAFRERERAMNEALLAAQQLRVDAEQRANRDAETIIREAKAEALRLVHEAQQAERLVRERAEGAKRQLATYLSNFRALLERHLSEVDGLQAHTQAAAQSQTEMALKREA